MDFGDILPWLPLGGLVLASVTATVAIKRLRVERERQRTAQERNEMLARQLAVAQEQLEHLKASQPRPDVRIVELKPTGGGSRIDFSLYLQNVGTQAARPAVSARVGDEDVWVNQPVVDLLPNAAPVRISISVRRPELGELVQELDNVTTLYGEALHVRVAAGEHVFAEQTWTEERYDPETDRARYEAQQRAWRRGRGEETDGDRRAEFLRELDERAAR